MYRTVEDFVNDWSNAAQGTIQVLESLSDDKLDQAIVEGHSTLGWLGWHLANSPAFFGSLAGLQVEPAGDPETIPASARTIAEGYKKVAEAVEEEAKKLTDGKILEKVEAMGTTMPRGALLRTLIDHQTHHRGQMTVLLRQAGLQVPGVMGPTKEESS